MTQIKAMVRSETGKKVNRLRKKGHLPAVLYGEKVASMPISVARRDFDKAYKEAGESTLITLDIDGKPFNVLIHDVAHDVLNGAPIHADFYAVRMDKALRATVPIEFIGESPAVKNFGGILIKVVQELEVEALAQDLPHNLSIDLSTLADIESKAHVKDIKLPKGVKIIAERNEIIAIVEPPRTEEELKELDQAVGAATEVKTEGELDREAKAGTETEKAEETI